MRVLVTGAAGFIGSHVCEALLAGGHEVIGLDGFIPNYDRAIKQANLLDTQTNSRFKFVEADLRTAKLEALLDGVEAVINEAGMPGLLASWRDLEVYAACNLVALGRLVDACATARVRKLVHVSTSSVYGAYAVGDETLPTTPVSPYGVTKLAGDLLLMAHVSRSQFPAVIVRYFSVYGPRQRPDMGYHQFIESVLNDREISVFGDGSQSRSVTYVADCVAATLAAVDRGVVGEIYNIGGGAEITVHEAIELIGSLVGREPRIVHVDERPGDQARTFANTSKARAALGWQPFVLPEDGLRAQVEWHIARRAGRD